MFLFGPPLSRLPPSPQLVGGLGLLGLVPADQYPGMRPLSLANTSRRLWEVNEVPAGTRHSTLPWANHKWWMYLNEGHEYDMMSAMR